MRHCTPDELLDLLEGSRAEAELPHLASCADCRRQLEEVRHLVAEVREVAVPEPSPEQWARLSAQVHDAVAAEAVRTGSVRWPGWKWMAPVAAAAALAFAVALPRIEPAAPVTAPSAQTADTEPASASSAVAPAGREPVAEPLDDPSLGLMFDLAAVVDLESEGAAVLGMDARTLDGAVGDLSRDEQNELARLLKEVIGTSGA